MKKIINILISDFYKVEIFRTLICIFRFVYFYYIRKNISFYINPEKKIDDHITVKTSQSLYKNKPNETHTVISHNMHFVQDILNLKKTYKTFSGSKTIEIIYPLKSIDSVDFENDKVLSVGPRNEGELFVIRSLGFKWKNIKGLDLITYSKLTDLGDIHNSNYEANSFNVIVCGWVITYSNNFEKMLKEMIRITKNGGIVSIGFTYHPTENNTLHSTEQIIEKCKDNISLVYFNFDAYKKDKTRRRHSIIIFRVKK